LSKFNYTYDAEGSVTVWTQQSDSNAPRAYDLSHDSVDQLTRAVLRTTDPTPLVLQRYGYAYDNSGNRTTEQIDDNPLSAVYDSMNRLVSHQPGGRLLFKGTLNEAATVKVESRPAQVATDNKLEGSAQVISGTNLVEVKAKDYAGNERTNTYQVDVAGSSKSFSYDANGNLTGDGARTFEWDAENRLLAVNQGSQRSEFTYDGRGRRVRIVETDNGTVTSDRRYLWCGMKICEERNGGGSMVNKRFSSKGVQEGGVSYYYATDHLGSVRELIDGSGLIRSRYDYDPYGRVTKVIGDKNSSYTYTGHLQHEPTNLLLAPHRAYEPSLGRWIGEDPIGFDGGDSNMYVYVVNNPVNLIDSTGKVLAIPVVVALPPLGQALAGAGALAAAAAIGLMMGDKFPLPPSDDANSKHRPRPPSRPMGPESPIDEPIPTIEVPAPPICVEPPAENPCVQFVICWQAFRGFARLKCLPLLLACLGTGLQ
jgi:RHS repeat-associated protein